MLVLALPLAACSTAPGLTGGGASGTAMEGRTADRAQTRPAASQRQTEASAGTTLTLPPARPVLPPPASDPAQYAGHERLGGLAAQLAREHALDEAWVASVLAHARKTPDAQRFIMPASNPGAKNWEAYRKRFIEPVRLKAGQAFWLAHQDTLARAERTYGVPASIIVGILGVETIYGRMQGQYRVLDVLTTLSLDFPTGRSDRSAYFQRELGQWLSWTARRGLDPRDATGSFAGAMGLPQFMPSALDRHAVDFDGDGRIDLNQSAADAIGSVARYLSGHGWKTGMPTHFDVKPPEDTARLSMLLAPDIKPTFSAGEMTAAGARLSPEGLRHTGPLALVMVFNGVKAPSFVAGTENFHVITRYNQSSYYALAVIDLAAELRRRMPEGNRGS